MSVKRILLVNKEVPHRSSSFLIINLKMIMLLKNEFANVIELLIASTDSN